MNKSHIPSIVAIKTQEKEIELLLSQFENVNTSYINNLSQGFRDNASTDLATMADLNDRIIVLLSSARQEISAIYPKGIANQSALNLNMEKVLLLDRKLKMNERKLQIMMNKEMALDGSYESSTLQLYSYKYHYLFYFIVAAIIGWLLYRVFSKNNSELIETLILISGLFLLFHHFFLDTFISFGQDATSSIENNIKNLNL